MLILQKPKALFQQYGMRKSYRVWWWSKETSLVNIQTMDETTPGGTAGHRPGGCTDISRARALYLYDAPSRLFRCP